MDKKSLKAMLPCDLNYLKNSRDFFFLHFYSNVSKFTKKCRQPGWAQNTVRDGHKAGAGSKQHFLDLRWIQIPKFVDKQDFGVILL